MNKVTSVESVLTDTFGEHITNMKVWSHAAKQIVLGTNPNHAAAAAKQLIVPEIYPLPVVDIMGVLWRLREHIEPVAIAVVVRKNCLEDSCGCLVDDDQNEFVKILQWTRQRAESFLMTQDELSGLATLPAEVRVYRGQRPEHHPKSRGITGMSWTTNGQIADSYTWAPEWPNGWLLTATVSKQDILVHIREWEESEVLIAPAHVRLLSAERGTATEHLRRMDLSCEGAN